MEDNKDILMQNRNAGLCIKYGFNLYFNNFKRLFKASWLPALAFAVVFSALGCLLVIRGPQLIADTLMASEYAMPTKADYTWLLTSGVLLIVVGGVLEVLSYSRGVEFLRMHRDNNIAEGSVGWDKKAWKTMLRTLKGVIFTLFIIAIPTSVMALVYKLFLTEAFAEPGAHLVTLIFSAIIMMVVVAFMIPLLYVAMKYIEEERQTYWRALKEGYAEGVRQMGFSFVILFIIILVITLATFIILQPAVIISIANNNAYLGQVYGDPLGLPDYVAWLTALVFFIAGFITIYIRMSALFTLHYMYGTIAVREEQSKRFNEDRENSI